MRKSLLLAGALCAQQLKDDLEPQNEELPRAAFPLGVERWEWDRLRGWGCVCSSSFLVAAVASAVTKGSEEGRLALGKTTGGGGSRAGVVSVTSFVRFSPC